MNSFVLASSLKKVGDIKMKIPCNMNMTFYRNKRSIRFARKVSMNSD